MAETEATMAAHELHDTETGAIAADTVVLTRSAARQVTAHDARLEDSAAVVVEGRDISVRDSACVQVLGESVAVVNSPTLVVGAERASFTESPIFLFLGRTTDAVTPVLDWRAAVGLGAGFGIAVTVVGAILGRQWRGR